VVTADFIEPPAGFPAVRLAAGQTSKLLLGLPFDLAREHYAKAVRAGLIERSMLGWAKFEQGLVVVEQLTLGPWARRV
jgi:hypothetical protein